MNLSALPDLFLSWFKTQGMDASQPGRDGAQFKPGQQYDGQVLGNLLNGRSLVKVGKETLDMPLPGGAKSGDTVRLTFLHAVPRPTFSVAQTAAAQPVRLSDSASQVSALVRYAQSPVSRVAASAAVSAAQRPIVPNANLMLSANNIPANLGAAVASRVAIPVMAVGGGQAIDGLRSALASNTNLATQGVTEAPLLNAQVLPQRLRQVVSESGMFYESHLARWAKGGMSADHLLREPQSRLSRQDLPQAGVPELKGMSDEAARLAGRQLVMLDGGPFVWQGQAWPGQGLEWRVEEEAGGGEGPDGEANAWRTELRLTLPRLGEVRAGLRLSAAGIEINLDTTSPETLELIQVRLHELAERLQRVRLKPLSLQAKLVHAEAET